MAKGDYSIFFQDTSFGKGGLSICRRMSLNYTFFLSNTQWILDYCCCFSSRKILRKVGVKWKLCSPWHVFFASWSGYREGKCITREMDPGRAQLAQNESLDVFAVSVIQHLDSKHMSVMLRCGVNT